MIDRRHFMFGALAVSGAALTGCDGGGASARYDAAAEAARAPLPAPAEMRDLMRFATLAANSHNTQAWRFRLGENRIDILPDLSRRTPAVDPDNHHLYVSLGAAAETLKIAASARGLQTEPHFVPAGDGLITMPLDASTAPASSSPLFEAIPHRQSTRADYDGKPLSLGELRVLQAAVAGDDVELVLLTDPHRIGRVQELIVEANRMQIEDPAFMAELKHWVRFNQSEALATRDGLFAASSGNPTLPGWVGRRIFNLVVTAKGEGEKIARQIRSSSGLAILVSKADDRAHWVAAGRAYQRFALTATAMGLKLAFLNQAVEVPSVRTQLAHELGITSGRPDVILRFGRGPETPRSLRRPVEDVLV